jgi:hypothetical protein
MKRTRKVIKVNGKPMRFYRDDFTEGIFSGQENWVSQSLLDRVQYWKEQAREGRRLKKLARERKKISGGW